MNNNVLIHDVAEVYVKSNEKLYFFGLTASNSVSQTIDSQDIFGGIGRKKICSIMTNKNMSFNVQTALHNPDLMELQSGGLFANGSIDLYKQESVQAKDVEGSITLEIEGTPVDNEVTIIDQSGKELTGTYSSGTITIPTGAKKDEYYTVIYKETQANAEILDLNVEKMPGACECQLHTIGYNPETLEISHDIYWNFLRCRADGNMEVNYSSDNMQDSVRFNCEVPLGGKSFGSYVVVARA